MSVIFNLRPTVTEDERISNADIIFLQLYIRTRKMKIGLVYRPPSSNNATDKKLYDHIIGISNTNDCVILGDFNLPVTSWGGPLSCHRGQELYNGLIEVP